jgi:type IV pilus assembly protein PilE
MLRLVTTSRRLASRGFTLIELLVVLVIIGILASLALPSFVEFVRKGRRADAVAALTLIQQTQERWRANNARYSSTLSALNLSDTTASGYYTLAITGDAAGFSASATAAGVQQSDGVCKVITLTLANGSTTYGSTDSAGVVDSSLNNRCWAK